jgi:O-antigen/teichoic acid export membrane protein
MTAGVAWMVAFRMLDKVLGFGSTLILARLLTPADFGIVAMAMTVVAFLEVSTSFGFDTALIQKQDASRELYDTAWTFGVMLGCAIAVLLVALAIPAATFYREPAVAGVMAALALGGAASGFENIGVVAFRKELRFDREFRYLLVKRLLGMAITIPVAIVTRSYWALVAGMVFGRVGSVVVSYLVHPYRPRFALSGFGQLFDFSKWVVLVNFLHFFKERSSDFVLGRLQGAGAVGLFSVAYELASLPATELVAPINRAVYPAYAAIAHDRGRLRVEYLVVMAMITLVAVPAVAGVAATASLIVPVVLGDQWLAAAPILAVLAYFGLTQVTLSNAHAVYLAVGKPRIQAGLSLVHVAVLLATLVPLTLRNGVIGAASAYLVVAVVMMPLNFGVVMRVLEIPLRELLAVLWRPALAALAMYALVQWTIIEVAALNVAIQLPIAVVVGALAYILVVTLLWALAGRPEGPEAVLFRRAAAVLRRAAA